MLMRQRLGLRLPLMVGGVGSDAAVGLYFGAAGAVGVWAGRDWRW